MEHPDGRGMSLTFESARLEALVEAARMLQGASDVDQLLQHLLRSAMAHVLARRGTCGGACSR